MKETLTFFAVAIAVTIIIGKVFWAFAPSCPDGSFPIAVPFALYEWRCVPEIGRLP